MMCTMNSYQLTAYRQPLQSMEVPVRQPGPHEVLVRVHASGLCHSDLPVMDGIRPAVLPVTLGHECSGRIVKLGAGVTGLAEGGRISVYYVLPCERCETCKGGLPNACPNRRSIGLHQDGGFAEYLTIPAANAIPLPDSVSFEVGAIAGCAVSTAFHAVAVAQVREGETIAVIGLGGVGLHVAELAKLRGASMVIGIDTNPQKRRMARQAGVDLFIHTSREPAHEALLSATGRAGVDVAFECVGRPETYLMALDALKPGGRACLVGVCTDPVEIRPFPLLLKEVRILFAVNHTREEQRQVLELASQGACSLSNSITHRFPLAKIQEGFDLLRTESGEVGKIVVLNGSELE